MSVTIIHKKGSGIPSADSLQVAEIAVDVVTGKLYTKKDDGKVVEISGSSDGSGGGGFVHVGEAPPSGDLQEGQEWLKIPADGNATMWIWDGEKWLQHPSGGSGGGSGDVDLSDYYTKAESEEKFLETESDPTVGAHIKAITQEQIDAWDNPSGGGGAEAIEATFYESVQLSPTSTDSGGITEEYKYVWVVDDRDGVVDKPDQRTNIYSAGGITCYTVDASTVRAGACNLDNAGTGLKTPSIVSGRIATVEHTVFGGINIPAADEERPDGLPYSPDEKSFQYTLTVTHETLGRTVEIDKEGLIRANQFADMQGNPIMQTLTQAEYDAITPNAETVYFIV